MQVYVVRPYHNPSIKVVAHLCAMAHGAKQTDSTYLEAHFTDLSVRVFGQNPRSIERIVAILWPLIEERVAAPAVA